MAEIPAMKTLVAQLRTTLEEMRAKVAAVEGELVPLHPSILRGLTALEQPRRDPHRVLRTPRTLQQWVRALDTATTALEAMSSRWP